MPEKKLLMRVKSRDQLTTDFLTLFDCPRLPSETELISFLEQHELACIAKKEVSLKLITKSENSSKHRQIICLPVSIDLTDNFTKEFSDYLRQENCLIVLYWTWKLHDSENYVAVRFSFERLDEKIYFQSDILNPSAHYFVINPIEKLIRALKNNLPNHEFILLNGKASNSVVVGDPLYWTMLSLFLQLAKDEDENYFNVFKIWQQNSRSSMTKTLEYIDKKLLTILPYAHSYLFYSEHMLAILKMSLFQKRIGENFIPDCFRRIPHARLLRIAALGHIFYKACTEGDYLALYNLPLIFGLHYLTKHLTKKSPGGFSGLVVFSLCQLISISSQLAVNLYVAMPGSPIEQEIIAPRYILQWVVEIIKETQKLPVRLIAMFFFYCFLTAFEKKFDKKILDSENNQAGFRAIAFFTIQFFIALVGKYLFEFKSWLLPQNAEEQLLFFISRQCGTICHLEIKTSLSDRIFQQAFFRQQAVSVDIKNANHLVHCDISISQHVVNEATSCVNYQTKCQSHFFGNESGDSTFAVVKPPVVHPIQTFGYCS